jgi:hypothetical protein
MNRVGEQDENDENVNDRDNKGYNSATAKASKDLSVDGDGRSSKKQANLSDGSSSAGAEKSSEPRGSGKDPLSKEPMPDDDGSSANVDTKRPQFNDESDKLNKQVGAASQKSDNRDSPGSEQPGVEAAPKSTDISSRNDDQTDNSATKSSDKGQSSDSTDVQIECNTEDPRTAVGEAETTKALAEAVVALASAVEMLAAKVDQNSEKKSDSGSRGNEARSATESTEEDDSAGLAARVGTWIAGTVEVLKNAVVARIEDNSVEHPSTETATEGVGVDKSAIGSFAGTTEQPSDLSSSAARDETVTRQVSGDPQSSDEMTEEPEVATKEGSKHNADTVSSPSSSWVEERNTGSDTSLPEDDNPAVESDIQIQAEVPDNGEPDSENNNITTQTLVSAVTAMAATIEALTARVEDQESFEQGEQNTEENNRPVGALSSTEVMQGNSVNDEEPPAVDESRESSDESRANEDKNKSTLIPGVMGETAGDERANDSSTKDSEKVGVMDNEKDNEERENDANEEKHDQEERNQPAAAASATAVEESNRTSSDKESAPCTNANDSSSKGEAVKNIESKDKEKAILPEKRSLSEEGTNDNDDEGKEETKEEGKDDKDKDNSKAKDVSSKITVNGEVDPSERDGLTTEQAEELYKTVGFNELPTIDIPIWWVFLEQYTGTMPYMLELAVIIAGAVEDWIDFGIIIAIVSIIIP